MNWNITGLGNGLNNDLKQKKSKFEWNNSHLMYLKMPSKNWFGWGLTVLSWYFIQTRCMLNQIGSNTIKRLSSANEYTANEFWGKRKLQYIPRNMHMVFAFLCFVVVIHWLIFPYPSGLLHWHCGNLTIAPVPAKQPWWIWINTSCEFIMHDCITTTKQSTTKPRAYFLGYTVWGKRNAILLNRHFMANVTSWPR